MKKIDNDFKYKIIGVITLLIFLIIGMITSNNFNNNSKKIILSSRKIAVGYVIKITLHEENHIRVKRDKFLIKISKRIMA